VHVWRRISVTTIEVSELKLVSNIIFKRPEVSLRDTFWASCDGKLLKQFSLFLLEMHSSVYSARQITVTLASNFSRDGGSGAGHRPTDGKRAKRYDRARNTVQAQLTLC
jgi:hypothetical protein